MCHKCNSRGPFDAVTSADYWMDEAVPLTHTDSRELFRALYQLCMNLDQILMSASLHAGNDPNKWR